MKKQIKAFLKQLSGLFAGFILVMLGATTVVPYALYLFEGQDVFESLDMGFFLVSAICGLVSYIAGFCVIGMNLKDVRSWRNE